MVTSDFKYNMYECTYTFTSFYALLILIKKFFAGNGSIFYLFAFVMQKFHFVTLLIRHGNQGVFGALTLILAVNISLQKKYTSIAYESLFSPFCCLNISLPIFI